MCRSELRGRFSIFGVHMKVHRTAGIGCWMMIVSLLLIKMCMFAVFVRIVHARAFEVCLIRIYDGTFIVKFY